MWHSRHVPKDGFTTIFGFTSSPDALHHWAQACARSDLVIADHVDHLWPDRNMYIIIIIVIIIISISIIDIIISILVYGGEYACVKLMLFAGISVRARNRMDSWSGATL